MVKATKTTNPHSARGQHSRNAAHAVGSVERGGVSTTRGGLDLEKHAIGVMQTGGLMMPIAFTGSMAFGLAGWLAHKALKLVGKEQAGVELRSSISAVFGATNHTRLKDIKDLPKNYLEVRKALVKGGGSLTAEASDKLTSRLAREGGKHPVQWFQSMREAFSPVTTRVASALNAFDKTSIGETLAKPVQAFAGRKEKKLLAEATKHTTGLLTEWRSIKKSGGVGALLQLLPKAIGRARVFNAMVIGGAALASGAMILSGRRQQREDKTALHDFAADIYDVPANKVTKEMISGARAHPMLKEASKIYDKSVVDRRIYNTLNVAGDIAMGSTLGASGMSPLMIVEMAFPQIAQALFTTENPSLAMYQMLKQHEKGEVQLTPEQRMQAVAELLATVPSVASNTGTNNELVGPMAYEMVARGMSTKQILRTLATPETFVGLTKHVQAKVAAEQAAQEAQAGQTAPQLAQEPAAKTHAERVGRTAPQDVASIAAQREMQKSASYVERYQQEPRQSQILS